MRILSLHLLLLFIATSVRAGAPAALDECNVVWNSPGGSSAASMPVGNGDVGLNAWVEKNGDLVFLIGKNDAWSDDLTSPGYGAYGLIKVGRVRVSLSPNPFSDATRFRQVLKLREGAMVVESQDGSRTSQLRLWVDANRPAIHVEATCADAVTMRVAMESWRKTPTEYLGTDKIIDGHKNRVVWFYRNKNKVVPMLVNRTVGAVIEGEELVSKDAVTLESSAAKKSQHVAIHTLTAQSESVEAWLAKLEAQVAATRAVAREQAWREHCAWWEQFWNRSWIFVSGDAKAQAVTEGYMLQRFKNACSSRGEFPIKFNGSIFNVEDPHPVLANDKVPGEAKVKRQVKMPVTPDFRSWGYQYWFQNTRPMYWPLMASGDFDLMQPLFRMYRAMLEGNAQQVREFYGHDGAYFRETAPAWGGLNKLTNEEGGYYTKHYYTPILELSAMMLDYFAYTGDTNFLRQTLLPVADAGVTFFDKHFPHEAGGRLRLEPDNSIEMFWKVRNPLPDVAGLRFVLQGLLALPEQLTTAADRARWKTLLAQVPPVPVGERNGKQQLVAFEEGQKAGSHNSENPELYAVYPFRLFGLGRPDFNIALNAFAARKVKSAGCWSQDAAQAALLGDAETAKKDVIKHLTNKDQRYRFPAFWAKGHDYAPDEDNGGNGLHGLQLMLVQFDGAKIRLLPAWPKDWSCQFKLHAPMQTTVEGKVHDGKIEDLVVTPEARRKDVSVQEGRP